MRRRLTVILPGLLCAAVLAACGSSSSSTSSAAAPAATGTASSAASSSATPPVGFENVPLETGPSHPPLAPASTTGVGKVDGISCASAEQLAYHIHAHLAVFDAGRLYQLPGGIGIPGSHVVSTPQGPVAAGGRCIYWLHTHAPDGIIHVESPTKTIYTLGDFFDEWRQPLGRNRVASLHGAVTALVNGRLWKASPRAIPLLSHEDIQLEIGQPTPPFMRIDWSVTQL